jgi:hypothetical protein
LCPRTGRLDTSARFVLPRVESPVHCEHGFREPGQLKGCRPLATHR